MRWIVGIFVLILAVGCAYFYFRGDPLREALDKRWQPVNADQQRQASIDYTKAQLTLTPEPNLAIGLDLPSIQPILLKKLGDMGVKDIKLTTDRQLLHLTASADRTLTADDLPPNSNQRALVDKLTPHVKADIDLYLTAKAELVTADVRSIQFNLLPALHTVHVDEVTLAGQYDVGPAVELVAALLNRYADNLSAAVTKSPLMEVKLPTVLQKSFDPSGPVKVNIKELPDFKLNLEAKPVQSPFGLAGIALLLDADKITILAQLSPVEQLPKAPTIVPAKFEDLRSAFESSLKAGTAISSRPNGAWVAIGKALIARTLTSAFGQLQPCVSGSTTIPQQDFSSKVPTPDGSSMNCSPTDTCSTSQACDQQTDGRDCHRPRDCPHSHDTRDCRKCAFGVCVNDPVCEGQKAAQNVIYDSNYSACTALGPVLDATCEAQKGAQNALYVAAQQQCVTNREAARIACQAKNVALTTACQSAKLVVQQVHQTGNLANLDGSISGSGALKFCVRDVSLTDSLDKLSLTLNAAGSAGLDTHFKFVPLDVAGHVLCQVDWAVDKHFDTTVPDQSMHLDLSLKRRNVGSAIAYDGDLSGLEVKLHFQPSPLSLILQNINFELACPATAGLIRGFTLGLGPLIPELLKDYTYKPKPFSFSITPDLPSQKVEGKDVKLNLSESPLALILTGTPSQ